MKRLFLFFFLVAGNGLNTQSLKRKLPDDMLSYFTGQWKGDGAFANGKKISANVSYKLSLDSTWLVEKHADILPNRYKSVAMWGADSSGNRLMAYVFDNSGGHRKFVSTGWQAGKLVLSTKEFMKGRGNIFEHFIYEKRSAGSFRMTFEVSRDGKEWKLVDSLLFQKINTDVIN